MDVPGRLQNLIQNPLFSFIAQLSQQLEADILLVGGALRDMMLGREAHDLDFIVSKDPCLAAEKVAASFQGTLVLLDEKHRIFRVVLPKEECYQTLDFSPLSGSVEEDLLQRDFTVNAIAFSLTQKTFWDPAGGLRDLEEKSIRHIREEGFLEDPLRLLRAFRLGATLAFQIHPSTLEAIKSHGSLIHQSSGERIREELLKFFSLTAVSWYLELLDDSGLLAEIFPEMIPLKEIPPQGYHHLDGWHHSLETVRQLELLETETQGPLEEFYPILREVLEARTWSRYPTRALLKLAALLHDIGKPSCRLVEEGGKESYIGHASYGEKILLPPISRRLRLSHREEQLIGRLIKEHLRLGFLAYEEAPSKRALYRYCRDLGEAALPAIFLSLADRRASMGPLTTPDQMERAHKIARLLITIYLDEKSPLSHPQKLLSGKDLIEEFHLKPGPQLGVLLKDLEEAQAIQAITSREEALSWMRRRLNSRKEKC